MAEQAVTLLDLDRAHCNSFSLRGLEVCSKDDPLGEALWERKDKLICQKHAF